MIRYVCGTFRRPGHTAIIMLQLGGLRTVSLAAAFVEWDKRTVLISCGKVIVTNLIF